MKHCKQHILMCLCFAVCLFATAQQGSLQDASRHNTLHNDTLSAAASKLLNTIIQTATDTSLVLIGDISVHGNKKTQPYIIEREIPFKQGDYILRKDLEKNLLLAEERVRNTALFTQVFVYIANAQGNIVFINVDVQERWYIFPLPYFKLVDRNFNQWWVEQKASINRVNYGIKFSYNNVSGRNDKLNVYLINGYSQQVLLRYEQPFADKALKNGFSVMFNFSHQRELNYATELNKQSFFKQKEYVMQNMKVEGSYLYRPAIKTQHRFSIAYVRNQVSDTILHLNPHYYPANTGNRIAYPEASYVVRYFDADYNAYPRKGIVADAGILNRGFSKEMNLTQLGYHVNFATPLNKRTHLLLQSSGMIKFPFRQPFYNQQIFGYGGTYFRGLEYYISDGIAGVMGRATLHTQIFGVTFKTPPNSKKEISIPFKFYLKAGADMGYVYSRTAGNNLLANKPIYTETIGLDIVIPSYDIVFKINYSFNQLGQSGLFLHTRGDF